MGSHTHYCPYCGSENIHRVETKENIDFDPYYIGERLRKVLERKDHYHECSDCAGTWEHHK